MTRDFFRSGPGLRFGTGGPPTKPIPARRPPTANPDGLLPAIQSLLYVLVFALFLITFTVQPIRIPSSSMEPTLLVGDFLLLNKQSVTSSAFGLLPPAGIQRGDVIVFHDPVDDPSIHLVKRVIALPGDRVHLRNGVVYLNERPVQESYAVRRPAPQDSFRDNFPSLESRDAAVHSDWWINLRSLVHAGEITVPPQSYFVMGDNRNDSEDSRYWGFVPRDAVVGKPFLIYFSYRETEGAEPGGDAVVPLPGAALRGLGNTDVRQLGRTHLALPDKTNTFRHKATDFARWDRIFRVVH